jgi:TPR repeat protein
MAQNNPVTPAGTQENAVDKPENDEASLTDQKPAAETVPAKQESADSADLDHIAEAAENSTEASVAAKSKTTPNMKRATPAPAAEPQFNNTQVDEAERYLRGQGVAQDCSRAISLLRSSAREGNPRAQVKLGALYATGQCVTQDRAAAYQWLMRAQETQPRNSYLQRTMNTLWANMTPEERDRITH